MSVLLPGMPLPGDHDSRAGAIGFREAAPLSEPNPQRPALGPHYGTIRIGFIEPLKKPPPACAAAAAGGEVIAGLAKGGQRAGRFEAFSVQDFSPKLQKKIEGRAGAWPIDTRLNGRARRDPYRCNAAPALP
jgi:hypothetical protein